MKKITLAKVLPTLHKIAEDLDYEIVEAKIEKEKHGKYLRVYLYSSRGITLTDCENYHRKIISFVENIDYDYLEVCSPGIDRPLKTEKDYMRHIGDLLEIKFYKAIEGHKTIVGRLLNFEEGKLTIELNNLEHIYEQKDIALAKIYIDMDEIEKTVF